MRREMSEGEKEIKAFTIRVPKRLHRVLREIAFLSDTTMNEIIINILENAKLDELREKAEEDYYASYK